jgi:uncharacterized protein (DUF2235 family)
MSKKIIVLSNGTGNSSADVCKTNVWRLYQALDLSAHDQMALYDDGVGTSSFKPLAILGGTTGWGLKRNVLDLYTYICRNYEPVMDANGHIDASKSDEIYAFGFSRGSFTIRVLIGLITSQGIVRFSSQEELDYRAASAYRAYRKTYLRASPIVSLSRRLRDGVLLLRDKIMGYQTYDPHDPSQAFKNPPIRFLGLWDTVDAYGVPVREMKIGIDRYLWPMAWSSNALSPLVQRACHALALDDERRTFHPLAWDEGAEQELVAQGKVEQGRLTQAWFAGMHSNVGGGYPDDALAYLSLSWLNDEAMHAGLRFSAPAIENIRTSGTAYGKQSNSRAGLSGYYRYQPRLIQALDDEAKPMIQKPMVHESVVQRMALGGDNYVPLPLGRDFDVLCSQAGPAVPQGNCHHAQPQHYTRLPFDTYRQNLLSTQSQPQVQHQIKAMQVPSQEGLEIVSDHVWWRRLSYSLTLLITLLFVIFPVLPLPPETSTLGSLVTEQEVVLSALTNRPFDMLASYVPSFLSLWIDAFRVRPWMFFTLLVLLASSFSYSNFLERRIRDRARMVWGLKNNNLSFKSLHFPANQKVLLATLVMLLVVAGTIIIWSTPQLVEWRMLSTTLTGGGFCIWWDWMLRAHERRVQADPATKNDIFLRFARFMRTHPAPVWCHATMHRVVLPIGYALLLVFAAFFVTNRLSFSVMVAAGKVCENTSQKRTLALNIPVQLIFHTANPCAPTGLWMEKGAIYRIRFVNVEGWRDENIGLSEPLTPLGFGWKHPDAGWRTWLATPLLRSISEKWFVPFAHIGDKGGKSFALAPNSHRITVESSGALSFYVNDAVLGLPRVWSYFYANNKGTLEVQVTKIEDPEQF